MSYVKAVTPAIIADLSSDTQQQLADYAIKAVSYQRLIQYGCRAPAVLATLSLVFIFVGHWLAEYKHSESPIITVVYPVAFWCIAIFCAAISLGLLLTKKPWTKKRMLEQLKVAQFHFSSIHRLDVTSMTPAQLYSEIPPKRHASMLMKQLNQGAHLLKPVKTREDQA